MKKRYIILPVILLMLVSAYQFAFSSSATQIEMFLNGVTDPNTFAPASSGVVYTYSAGTTTNKTVWTDRAKATPAQNPFTLNSMGQAQVYGEGIYKFVIKDAVGGTTLYTYDNISIGTVQGPWVDVSQYASLTAAVTAIGSINDTTLLISGTTTLTANTTVTDNITLLHKSPGLITCGTYTVLINGPFDANPQAQVFDSTCGTSDVAFGVGSIKEAYSEWWGAAGDDTTEIQSALNAFSILRLLKKTYVIDTVTMNTDNSILGIGRYVSILKAKTNITDHVIYATGKTGLTIKDLSLNGDSANQSGMVIGIDFQDCSSVMVENNEIFNNSGSYEIRIQSIASNISNITVRGNNVYRSVADTGDGSFVAIFGTDAVPLKTASNVLMENNYIHSDVSSALKDGTELVGTSGLIISNNRIHGMGGYGISIDVENIGSVQIISNTCYSNGFSGIGLMGGTSTVFPSSASVIGNSCYSNTQNGITVTSIPRVIVSGNSCIGNGYRGITIETALASESVISGNICNNNGSGLSGLNAAGIYIGAFSDGVVIGDNLCTNTTGTIQEYGIRLDAGSTSTALGRNSLAGNNTGDISIAGTVASQKIYSDFIFGTHGNGKFISFNTGDDIVSASTITPNGIVSSISGTTTVNTIAVPSGMIDGAIILIPAVTGVNFGTSGNIATGITGTAGISIIMTYSHWTSKWYPN